MCSMSSCIRMRSNLVPEYYNYYISQITVKCHVLIHNCISKIAFVQAMNCIDAIVCFIALAILQKMFFNFKVSSVGCHLRSVGK